VDDLLDLPMLAFRIAGIYESVELIIDEVWGFPNEISYGGGYGAKGILTICAGDYSVSSNLYFTTGELYRFFNELTRCYETLSGTATLDNTDNTLNLKCEFNKRGHVFISGRFQADPAIKNILLFEFTTDQTHIKGNLFKLEAIYRLFGDEKGKR
jgi:hypothetical protein